jgi:hypothetical protein
MFSVITNIYNTKTKGPTLMDSFTATGKLKKLQFALISSDCAENWPEPVERHVQRLMGDRLVSACTDPQR